MPGDAKFCMDCGYSFNGDKSNIFTNGKIFLVIIAIVVILGLVVIATMGNNTSDDVIEHVDLTVTGVGGYYNGDDEKPSYTLYTEVLYTSVPQDMEGYKIKTTYYDSSDNEIGHEISSLESEYSNSEYGTYIGYYTAYSLPDPSYVTVEITKNGNVIDTFTENVDKNKIEFLN